MVPFCRRITHAHLIEIRHGHLICFSQLMATFVMDTPSARVLRWRWHDTESQDTHVRHGEWGEILLHHYKVLGFGGDICFCSIPWILISDTSTNVGYFEGPGWKRSHSPSNKQTVSDTIEHAQEGSTSI